MDVATSDVPVNVESIEMTSVVEEKRDGDGGEESLKRPRFDEGVNKVAEIVLVLSALQRIRGGKTPTELEMELMVEARSKLAEMCQEFTPNDIIGRDAIGAVIEDLGLNGKVKDQRLGFRAPKLTISEKLSLGKRKMEESKKNTIVSTSSTTPGHSTFANNLSMAHQWPNSEMKAPTSSVNATGSHFVRDASGITQSRIERPQFKSDMHTGASQGPVPAGNYFGNATTWSAQPHSSSSTISFGTASDSKVHVQNSSRVADPSFRPFMSQSSPGTFQGIKGVNYGQTSSPIGTSTHAEIAKLIHKVLQPRAKQNLLWNPPSREYMSKPMKCQMCQGTINEVETLLICDACEKGYHLKCLQAHNMKGVPKSEWHCSSCVQLYNGKSFPPKYGRVMRSATTAKMSSTTAEAQLPAEKKVGNMNQEAVSHSETAKASEDETAMSQTVEAEDTAQTQAADTDYESQGPVDKMNQESVSQTAKAAEDEAAMSPTVEAEDADLTQAADAKNESQGPIGNDVKCDNPSESVEKREDPSKDVTERSVSANSQDKTSKVIEESSLQEENSTFQLPSAESNTDHTQQQNTTPEEAMQKNVTENPQEDKSC